MEYIFKLSVAWNGGKTANPLFQHGSAFSSFTAGAGKDARLLVNVEGKWKFEYETVEFPPAILDSSNRGSRTRFFNSTES